MIKGLTHAAIRVTDIEQSIRFYCDILGLEERFRLMRDDGTVGLVYLQIVPGQFIELFPGAPGPRAEPQGSSVVHVCLEVDDIQESYREMTARGLEATREPKVGGDRSWQFWTKDPDGNPIEFHQFTPDSMQVTGG